MSWHGKRGPGVSESVLEPDPIVYDVHGMPVGVRIAGTGHPDDETPASRHLARVTALRKTRELEGRHWISLGLF